MVCLLVHVQMPPSGLKQSFHRKGSQGQSFGDQYSCDSEQHGNASPAGERPVIHIARYHTLRFLFIYPISTPSQWEHPAGLDSENLFRYAVPIDLLWGGCVKWEKQS